MAAVGEKSTTVLSTKGQVILPKPMRDHLGWRAGARLVVEDTGDGVLLTMAPCFAPTRGEDVFGSLPHDGPPKTLAEMDAAIARETRRRHARDRY